MLFTTDELSTLTAGQWIRRPGSEWNPAIVRSTNVDPIQRSWLPRAIMFMTSERQLSRWFATEEALKIPAGGCVVFGPKLAKSRNLPRHRALLSVPHVDVALKALAMFARARMRGKLVAVTGTVGKSTTKSMLAHILGGAFSNIENGNWPPKLFQALASMPENLDVAVMEMGLGWAKDAMRDLSAVARPDVVVLTNVDIAHVDKLTDEPVTPARALELVAEQKLQLAERMRPGGALVVNSAIPFLRELRDKHRVLSFGEASGNDAVLLAAESDGSGTRVSADVRGVRVDYTIPLPGRFMALNSVAALLAASELGVEIQSAAIAVAKYRPIGRRANLVPLTVDGKHVMLIDDSFNATPASVRSTFDLLRGQPAGRRLAILGDIAHLGKQSAAIHAGLAGEAESRGIDRIYTFGGQMRFLQEALPRGMAAGHYLKRDALVRAVLSDLRDGDVITVKASIPSKFGEVVQLLKLAAKPAARHGLSDLPS